jgi:hypothetical protein
MARILSLTSASSSILFWRSSKIRGSTIPVTTCSAMFVVRGLRNASTGNIWRLYLRRAEFSSCLLVEVELRSRDLAAMKTVNQIQATTTS